MIHVLTVHFQTDRWIEIQLEYLARNVDRPYRVVADLEGVDGEWEGRVDTVTNLSAEGGESLSHQEKLNRLAARVGEEAPPDDVLMFIDGDAFPIAPVGALEHRPEAGAVVVDAVLVHAEEHRMEVVAVRP